MPSFREQAKLKQAAIASESRFSPGERECTRRRRSALARSLGKTRKTRTQREISPILLRDVLMWGTTSVLPPLSRTSLSPRGTNCRCACISRGVRSWPSFLAKSCKYRPPFVFLLSFLHPPVLCFCSTPSERVVPRSSLFSFY